MVSHQGIDNAVKTQHRQREQFLGWRLREQAIFFRSESWQTMARLRRNHDTRTARRDNVTKLFEQYCRAVKITLKIVCGLACVGETPAA